MAELARETNGRFRVNEHGDGADLSTRYLPFCGIEVFNQLFFGGNEVFGTP